jgi:transposase-like protein
LRKAISISSKVGVDEDINRRRKKEMAERKVTSRLDSVREILSDDSDWLKEFVRDVVQKILEEEMDEALGAEKGERSAGRRGYRSGYYQRSLLTRVGTIELRVPQDRNGLFSTAVFSRYQRSEKALFTTLAEMYVQGVSTRKVKAITEELCGHSFSASTISEITRQLDTDLETFARRRLSEPYAYVILDARYERRRAPGGAERRIGESRERVELEGVSAGPSRSWPSRSGIRRE